MGALKLPSTDSANITIPIHLSIGAAIIFFMIYILSGVLHASLSEIVAFLGYGGVMILDETTSAIQVLLFGVVYLPSGFLGGLYTGFRLNQDEMRVNLFTHQALLGVAGFSILFLARLILGFLSPSVVDYVTDILLPLSGCVLGGYLGGYAMNWPSEEESFLQEDGPSISDF